MWKVIFILAMLALLAIALVLSIFIRRAKFRKLLSAGQLKEAERSLYRAYLFFGSPIYTSGFYSGMMTLKFLSGRDNELKGYITNVKTKRAYMSRDCYFYDILCDIVEGRRESALIKAKCYDLLHSSGGKDGNHRDRLAAVLKLYLLGDFGRTAELLSDMDIDGFAPYYKLIFAYISVLVYKKRSNSGAMAQAIELLKGSSYPIKSKMLKSAEV